MPPGLRLLRVLVILLMVTMIAGLIVLVTVIVIRFPRPVADLPALPEAITLPAGAQAGAVTFGRGWVAVVTGDQRILVYDSATGALRREVAIAPGG